MMNAATAGNSDILGSLKQAWSANHELATLNVLRDYLLEHVPADLDKQVKPEDWVASQLNEVKKVSPAPALKIQLKNFVVNHAFSEETLMFRASIYLDGKRIGTVENEGRGGPSWPHFTNEAAGKRIADYVHLLPSMVFCNGTLHPKYDPQTLCRLTNCCETFSTFHDTTLCCKKCWNEVETGEGDGSEFVHFGAEDLDSFFSQLAEDKVKEKEKAKTEKWVKKQADATRARGFVPRRFEIVVGAQVSTMVRGFRANVSVEAALATVRESNTRGTVTGGEVIPS